MGNDKGSAATERWQVRRIRSGKELNLDPSDRPSTIWMKTRKGTPDLRAGRFRVRNPVERYLRCSGPPCGRCSSGFSVRRTQGGWGQPPLPQALQPAAVLLFGARAGVGDGFLLFLGLDHFGDREELVAVGEGEELYALGAAVGFPDVLHAAAHALALGGQQHDLVGIANRERTGEPHGPIVGQVDRANAAAAAIDEAVILKT